MRKYAVPAVILAVLALYTAYWLYIARTMPDRLALWAEGLRAAGYEVAYGEVAANGFPFRLVIDVGEVTIGGTLHTGRWVWRGDGVHALLMPWNLRRTFLTLPPEHRLTIVRDGRSQEFELAQTANQTAFVVDAGGLAVLASDIQGLVVRPRGRPPAYEAASLKLRFQRGEADNVGELRGFGIEVVNLTLPAAPDGLERTVALVSAVARLLGPLPSGPRREALGLWRDAGGTVELDSFNLRWGGLDVHADGTFALDGAMRPIGALSAEVEGYDELIEAAVSAGGLTGAQAFALRTALDLMATEDGETGSERLEVPLTIQDGRLYVGPAAVIAVPPLPLD